MLLELMDNLVDLHRNTKYQNIRNHSKYSLLEILKTYSKNTSHSSLVISSLQYPVIKNGVQSGNNDNALETTRLINKCTGLKKGQDNLLQTLCTEPT